MSEEASPVPAAPAPPAPQMAVAPAPAPAATMTAVPAAGRPPIGMRRLVLINVLAFAALILIALGAFYIWHQGYYFYSTDDATVSGTVVSVAAVQPGTVTTIYHGLGSAVHAGDTVATLTTVSGRTVLASSPINGTIISEGATLGEVLPAGQPLAQVVDLSKLYITAYVEETHIGDVATGQGVDVKVDAVKGATFHGTVSRILPAAASTFSLLPTTDYASGNFTKVTQRVPVQIALDGYQGQRLFPGESAEVTIHIHT